MKRKNNLNSNDNEKGVLTSKCLPPLPLLSHIKVFELNFSSQFAIPSQMQKWYSSILVHSGAQPLKQGKWILRRNKQSLVNANGCSGWVVDLVTVEIDHCSTYRSDYRVCGTCIPFFDCCTMQIELCKLISISSTVKSDTSPSENNQWAHTLLLVLAS